jgi:3'-phosphoadenosine 5'-phosphosulfate sulfotransferase (PAPS reductase)/FAD synthetase
MDSRIQNIIIERQALDRNKLCDATASIHTLVEEAGQRIFGMPFRIIGSVVYVGHSGGKDSVLVRWLTDRALGPGVMTIHTPKPSGIRNEVHPLTKEFLYSLNRPILYVPDGENLPRLGYKVQIDGTRVAEADRRDGRDIGLIVEGREVSRTETPLYLTSGLFGQNFCYPIYDWSDEEVWAAIFHYDIPVSPEYYHD